MQSNCWSLRCSWGIACRRWSNYIFILYLAHGFNILRKDNCKPKRETFEFWDLVRLILDILRYVCAFLIFHRGQARDAIGDKVVVGLDPIPCLFITDMTPWFKMHEKLSHDSHFASMKLLLLLWFSVSLLRVSSTLCHHGSNNGLASSRRPVGVWTDDDLAQGRIWSLSGSLLNNMH